ncbi:MAG TPA: HNH endonuclease [Candidatus Saccharimonadales bacterium]|jgi:hypothetical protein
MFELVATDGTKCLVDEEDYIKYSQYTWSARHTNSNIYFFCTINGKFHYLHRLITNAPSQKQVDHIDRNGLDCRKTNLRICSSSQNKINQPKRKDSKFKYKGIGMLSGRYSAIINKQYLGLFNTQEEAAKAYDKAAFASYGEFAYLNFPEEFA